MTAPCRPGTMRSQTSRAHHCSATLYGLGLLAASLCLACDDSGDDARASNNDVEAAQVTPQSEFRTSTTTPAPDGWTATIGSVANPVASDDIPPAVESAAQLLAESDPGVRSSLDGQTTVFVGSERLRIKRNDGSADPRYLVRVIHYRYDDDAALHTVIDADTASIVSHDIVPHGRAWFGEQEIDEIEALVLAHPQVQAALGTDLNAVKLEIFLVRTRNPEDPFFGQRVGNVLFRLGNNYVATNQQVTVNLTADTISVEESR